MSPKYHFNRKPIWAPLHRMMGSPPRSTLSLEFAVWFWVWFMLLPYSCICMSRNRSHVIRAQAARPAHGPLANRTFIHKMIKWLMAMALAVVTAIMVEQKMVLECLIDVIHRNVICQWMVWPVRNWASLKIIHCWNIIRIWAIIRDLSVIYRIQRRNVMMNVPLIRKCWKT